jgi:predicted secreted protein
MVETDITLWPGETFSLPLQGRGSAGYSWSFEVSGAKNTIEVRIAGASPPPHPPTQAPQAGSLDQQLVVKAIAAGEAQIQVVQRRSWERDKPPLAQHLVKVVVRPAS